MMSGIFAAQDGGIIGCVYPLDDDGTIAAAIGFGYAGPAAGGGQQLYNMASGTGSFVLAPDDPYGVDGLSKPASNDMVVEAAVTSTGSTAQGGLGFLISDSGVLVAYGYVPYSADGDVLGLIVDSAGVMTGKRNGYTVALAVGLGVANVSGTRKVAYALTYGSATLGDTIDMTLRTNASDITGSYSVGATDICGNAIA